FMTHETSTRTLSTSRRSSSRPVPWPALSIAVAALAALALATYPVRERLFTAVAGLAEGSALASAVGSVAEFGLLALVATAGVVGRARGLSCPGGGDWSWPSSHAALAAAFAAACILVVPRLAWFALPLALAIAASRVAAGVHYVHDVLSGLALGALVVAAVVAAASPVLDRRLTGGRDGHPDSASRSQGGRA